MKTLADCIKQMRPKDRAALRRATGANLAPYEPNEPHPWQTVAEYIKTHDVKTERRTSKRGIELIKVWYPTGAVKEYQADNIDRTIAFEN